MPAAAQNAQVVHTISEAREDLRNGNTALAARYKAIGRGEQIVERGAGDARDLPCDARRDVLAVEPLQKWLGIPRIDLARSAPHEEEDDVAGLRVFTHAQGRAFALGRQEAVLPQ
jgi:hypothetical protein